MHGHIYLYVHFKDGTLKTWKAHNLIFLLESYKRCRLVKTNLQDQFEVREKVKYSRRTEPFNEYMDSRYKNICTTG